MELSWLKDNALFVLSSFTIAWIAWKWVTRKKLRLPPGPTGIPILGYWPFLSRSVAHKHLNELKKKYGPLVSMYWGNKLVVALLDWPTLKEAFNRESFSGRPEISIFRLVEDGISFSDCSGHVWSINKKVSLQILHDLGFGKSCIQDAIQEEIAELMRHLEETGGKPIDTRVPLISSISNNVTSLVFGRRLEYDDPLRKFLDHILLTINDFFQQTSVHAYFPWIMKFLVFFRLWKYDRGCAALKSFYNFVDTEIEEHQKTIVDQYNRDYIDGYIQEIKKKADCEKDNLTIEHLKGNVRSFFAAGSETTRTAIEWCLMAMAVYQDYQEKVHQEIKSAIGLDRMPTMDDIRNTPLTHAIYLEVMRWRGVIPLGMTRRVMKDEKLFGYDIPEGTIVVGNIWGIHHDPDLWEDPMTFKPERFINKEGKVVKPEYYIPFSYGPRACPGEILSLVELYLYIATFFQKFHVLPPEGKADLFKETLGINLYLKDAHLKFIKRT